jgi:hypothetical protein
MGHCCICATPLLLTSANSIFKQLVPYFSSTHELLPSEKYFDLGGNPFLENFDFNNDGVISIDGYDYDEVRSTFNQRFATLPYEANRSFHEGMQDDWRGDTSSIEYHQLLGVQDSEETPEQIIAQKRVLLPSNPRTSAKFAVIKGAGDGTVPRLSAERIGNNIDLNGPNSSEVFSPRRDLGETDANVEHNGLTKNARVQQRVLEILGITSQSVVGSESHQGKEEDMSSELGNSPETNYLTIEGDVETLGLTDDLGRTNTPINDNFELAVPDVSYESAFLDGDPIGFYSHDLSLPTEREYTITFRTGNGSLTAAKIELKRGQNNLSPTYAVRYVDLQLPPNVNCILTVNAQGMDDLRYDSNGDGTYETVVPAHVRVSGAAAADVTAPNVSIGFSRGGGGFRRVTITATDNQSGVGTIYYRIGQTGSFQVYTGPFTIPTLAGDMVEAFADDNVGNRSSPVQGTVPQS